MHQLMRRYTLFAFIIVSLSACRQKESVIDRIDSITILADNQQSTLLSECDSIPDRIKDDEYVWRCWNFHFKDTAKTELGKVAISVNGFTEWLYYYEHNKVIKVQRNWLIKGKPKQKWVYYIVDDSEAYRKGTIDTIEVNEVESAYSFLRKAFELVKGSDINR